MSGDGIVGLRGFVFESSRLTGWRQRLFFFKLGNLGRVGLWLRRGRLRLFLVKTLGGVNGFALRDHGFLGHRNASGADEIHFRTAELAADSAPTGTVTLEKRGAENGRHASNVEEDGIFEIFPQVEFVRIGVGDGHITEFARGR